MLDVTETEGFAWRVFHWGLGGVWWVLRKRFLWVRRKKPFLGLICLRLMMVKQHPELEIREAVEPRELNCLVIPQVLMSLRSPLPFPHLSDNFYLWPVSPISPIYIQDFFSSKRVYLRGQKLLHFGGVSSPPLTFMVIEVWIVKICISRYSII